MRLKKDEVYVDKRYSELHGTLQYIAYINHSILS